MRQFTNKDVHVYIFESHIAAACSYCILKNDEALLIDAVMSDELVPFLKKNNIKKVTVLLTHAHYDHILGLPELRSTFTIRTVCIEESREILNDPRKNLSAFATFINEKRRLKESKTGQSIVIIPEYKAEADYYLKNHEEFKWFDLKIEFIYTPGHSYDSACILVQDKYLFSGDSINGENAPLLSLPGGNVETYNSYSLPIIQDIQKGRFIFPGHGEVYRVD